MSGWAQRCHAPSDWPGSKANRDRHGHWITDGAFQHAGAASLALPGERGRSADILLRCLCPRFSRSRRQLFAGTTRYAFRSHGRPQPQRMNMIGDFKFAFRQLFKTPGFTIAAATVLALGIGVNTAVFSLVNTLFFASPAYVKPHEMVQLFSQDKKDPNKFRGFSYPTYLDIREQNTVFSDAMSFNLALIGLGQKGDTRRAFGAIVSSNYFSVLGVPLARGRAFLPEEETPGRNTPVAIVSYSYWQKHNLDPAVLGSQVLVNGRPFTVVGITPRSFTGTMQVCSVEVWLPLSVYEQVANDFGSKNKTTIDDRNGTQLRIIARLKPGVTAVTAKPALEGLAANLEKAYPVEQKNQTFITAPVS